LKSIERSCLQCHADKQPQYLKERVIYTQERTWNQLLVAQEKSVRAHEAVRLAREQKENRSPDYDALLIEARENIRKGQGLWDIISAENSAGFHNPAKALDTLAKSQQCSDRAVALALKATNYEIGPMLEGDIKEIVPPIMNHSRKLQQSREHLDSHTWLGYLPLLPEAEKVWDGQKKLR